MVVLQNPVLATTLPHLRAHASYFIWKNLNCNPADRDSRGVVLGLLAPGDMMKSTGCGGELGMGAEDQQTKARTSTSCVPGIVLQGQE